MTQKNRCQLFAIIVLAFLAYILTACQSEPAPTPTTEPTPLPSPTPVQPCGSVTNSPYITKLAYASNIDGDYEICTLEAGASQAYKLTNNDVQDRYPAWSPDGQQLVYVSRVEGYYKLFQADINTGISTLLYEAPGLNIYEPDWSHDGTKIVMCVGQREEEPYTCIITILDIASGETSQPNQNEYGVCPEWSPDDTQIAFSGTLENKPTAFVIDIGGENPSPLEESELAEYCPHWMPVGIASEMLKAIGIGDPILAYTAYIPNEVIRYFYFITNKGERRNSVNITVPGSTEITDFSPDGLHVLMDVLDNPDELSRDIYFIEMDFNKFKQAIPLIANPLVDETDAAWSLK